jgi:hypothetical protein
MAKQWVTPTEQVNQPGMDWQWADEIYNYVNENWQDFLVGWMDLNPKNYVKPVILIEKIYQDEGGVTAWVHVEFVNLAGNSDAYMKLIISANIQGEENVEPEGREYSEHLTDWEIDVKDFGKSDELEKSSSYGPTNYQGPSVADHGYQNSAWDDMNVTYSPEEDEELMDQNGDGGYPNRWMSRHRGPYYTNEGKVVKMLEETKPQKQAAISGEIINHILNLIHQNGGATWNMSKGNLVGQPYFAVATFPEKEQIVAEADFENLEEYIINNESLLSNPNNSFGAWVSGGKTYYDIVVTLADKNEAMELGLKHNQLAIFDLKELKEIPLQKVAKLAAAVSDSEQQKYYDQIYSDRWRDDSTPLDAGNEYYKGWSELGSNDYPNPRDIQKEKVYPYLLNKGPDRLAPEGLPWYTVTFYDSSPAGNDDGGI